MGLRGVATIASGSHGEDKKIRGGAIDSTELQQLTGTRYYALARVEKRPVYNVRFTRGAN